MAAQEARSQGIGYRRKHLEYYDDKPIHYGILFAVPFTRFNIKHSNDFISKRFGVCYPVAHKCGIPDGFHDQCVSK
ncbi:hypothetical protein [Dyadobacter sp. 676]|uniref:Uncharacterized protein n=1 Tax=Dyadobacter sp. 676 TaxID=3088362 RepID=A0AAU8FTB7_9BACT